MDSVDGVDSVDSVGSVDGVDSVDSVDGVDGVDGVEFILGGDGICVGADFALLFCGYSYWAATKQVLCEQEKVVCVCRSRALNRR